MTISELSNDLTTASNDELRVLIASAIEVEKSTTLFTRPERLRYKALRVLAARQLAKREHAHLHELMLAGRWNEIFTWRK